MYFSLNFSFTPLSLILVLLVSSKSFAEKQQLQVVTELSPPYQMIVNNQVAGSTTKVVKEILAAANLTASFNMYPWARAYNKAVTEPNTLIYSMAKTAQRETLFHWLTPVVEYKLGLVTLSDRTDIRIKSVKDVANYVLAVQRNDIAHTWAIKQGLEEGKNLIICSDIGCSWKLLLNQRIDFIIESPELIEGMLVEYKQPITKAKFTLAIPELAVLGYLAANKNINTDILNKLTLAIEKQAW